MTVADADDDARHLLLHLLDLFDDHFDGRISDRELVRHVDATLRALPTPPARDPDVAAAVDALAVFASAAGQGSVPAGLYGNLRLALAELERPPGGPPSGR